MEAGGNPHCDSEMLKSSAAWKFSSHAHSQHHSSYIHCDSDGGWLPGGRLADWPNTDLFLFFSILNSQGCVQSSSLF